MIVTLDDRTALILTNQLSIMSGLSALLHVAAAQYPDRNGEVQNHAREWLNDLNTAIIKQAEQTKSALEMVNEPTTFLGFTALEQRELFRWCEAHGLILPNRFDKSPRGALGRARYYWDMSALGERPTEEAIARVKPHPDLIRDWGE